MDLDRDSARDPLHFLQGVIDRQANLVAKWLGIGFIHGVMNTDNTSISGETIDYGPCAFMDAFHQMRVFSSIDQGGRYAFGNQPGIAVWNMAQFATALVQLFEDRDAAVEEATEIVHAMPNQLEDGWLKRFAAKIGISEPRKADTGMLENLLALMQKDGADFTNTFRALRTESARDQFTDREAFDAWSKDWKTRVADLSDVADVMATANPAIIPRNHRIEQMIEAAVAGDMAPFERLMAALATPYDETDARLTRPPTEDEIVPATFCGT